MRERFWVGIGARSCWDAEGFEGGHRSDPRGDGGGEIFGEEGAEGLVLPGVDIAGGPVVEEAKAEDVMGCFCDRGRRSQRVRLADVEGQFEFVVEGGSWGEGGFEFWTGRT